MWPKIIKRFKKMVMVEKLKAIDVNGTWDNSEDGSTIPLDKRLERMWQNCVALSLKNKGDLMFSIIPIDMLMRMY